MFIRPVAVDPETRAEAEMWNQAQVAAWGYLPNYAAAFGSRPDVARAWNALVDAIAGGMDRRRYEVATIGAAQALRSTYCTAAHAKFLRDICGDEATMRSLARGNEGELADVDRAVLAFARKVAADASSVTEDDVAELRAAGLSDNDVADIVFAVAARSFFTRVLDACGIQADHQLEGMFEPSVAPGFVVGRPFASHAPALPET